MESDEILHGLGFGRGNRYRMENGTTVSMGNRKKTNVYSPAIVKNDIKRCLDFNSNVQHRFQHKRPAVASNDTRPSQRRRRYWGPPAPAESTSRWGGSGRRYGGPKVPQQPPSQQQQQEQRDNFPIQKPRQTRAMYANYTYPMKTQEMQSNYPYPMQTPEVSSNYHMQTATQTQAFNSNYHGKMPTQAQAANANYHMQIPKEAPEMTSRTSYTESRRLETRRPADAAPAEPSQIKAKAQEARSRAMNILQGFHQPQQQNDHHRERRSFSAVRSQPQQIQNQKHLRQAPSFDTPKVDPSEYSRKRAEWKEKFNKRKKLALLKNLEYVTRRMDEILQVRLTQIQESQDYAVRVAQQHQTILSERAAAKRQRQAQVMTSQGGIGTKERRKIEHKRKKHTQHLDKNDSDSLALYVSGLPTMTKEDNDPSRSAESSETSSTDAASELIETMRALFGSYGKLRKIHLYRNKQTNELKGDALVIYNVDSNDNRMSLVESVCSQMNGAELPDGSILSVETSDPLYKLRKPNKQNQYGPAATEAEKLITADDTDARKGNGQTAETHGATTTEESSSEVKSTNEEVEGGCDKEGAANDGEDDDLDDFFSSLE